jgi:predicted transcriptional regulator
MKLELQEHVATIVAAYVRKNQVAADQLTGAITAVYEALMGLGKPAEPIIPPTPAVPIHRSVGADQITCLECGRSGKTLRRHLSAMHGMTPNEYRTRWGLAHNFPMTAKNYSAERSAFAKSRGFGRKRRPE